MKRLSLILTVFLLGVMLVSCGTTLKKTSGKSGGVADIVNPALTMEKTAKPEKSLIEVKKGVTYLTRGYVFKIIAQKGTVVANAKVKMVIDYQRKTNPYHSDGSNYDVSDSANVPFREIKEIQAKADGSFGIVSESPFFRRAGGHDEQFKYIKISLTTKAEDKEESEPLELDGLEIIAEW